MYSAPGGRRCPSDVDKRVLFFTSCTTVAEGMSRGAPTSSGAGEVCVSDLNDASGSRVIRNSQITNGIKKSANMDVFSWVPEFRSKCRSTLGSGTSTLIELIRTFNSNVNTNVSECLKNPSLAVRLKDLIKEYMLLFMHLYRYEQPQDQNREDYLEQMSDMLAVYIDLELVASKLEVGLQHGQISSRLVSCLCVCLDYSTEHVLDTLMKIQLAYANFSHILDAIISKLLKLIPPRPQSALMYARYFLVYRLWQRINGELAVKRQPAPPSAEALLGPLPADMPAFLLERVLRAPKEAPAELQPVEHYLQRLADPREACAQFLQYCRPKPGPEDDITERDKRLKSTSTPVPNKLSTVNTNFSKSSNSGVKSLPSSSASNTPPVNSKRAHMPVKAKLPPKTDGGVEVIDLTSDEESRSKPTTRRPSRRRLDWLARAVQGVDAKIREAASQKRERELAVEERITEDTSRRVVVKEETVEAQGVEEPTEVQQRIEAEIEVKVEAVPVTESVIVEDSSENIFRPYEQEQPTLRSSSVERCAASSSGESPSRAEEKEQADSGFSESEALVPRTKQAEADDAEARSSFYDIQESNIDGLTLLACVLARQSATSNKSDKVLRLKDDERTEVPQEHPSVSAALTEKSSAPSVEENQSYAESTPRSEEKEIRANLEANEADVPALRNKLPEVNESEARGSFYDIQDSDLDGLTLLACVLARQSATSNKKGEIKVKPYASLQEKREPESRVVDRIVSICPEDALDKVALQVEVSSSEMVQSRAQSELVSYVIEEQPVQSSAILESNDNAHVILNGETVRLLQKSPNSNLYIINKAAVDNSKINYNSDEEEAGKPMVEPEESKCCPQGLMIKHEPEDVGLRRIIKPDPDYVGQPQPHELLYPGHPASSYCAYAPKIQQSAAGCACHSCVYCRQPPYYLPAPQPVQTNPAVQEKKCLPTVAEAKLYEDHQLMKQQPQLMEPVAVEDAMLDKFNLTDSKLPLKKRLKAQRMSMGFVEKPSPTYPGTLMMSIADVEMRAGHVGLELGAEVEVTAAKASKSRSSKNTKVKNHNMPDCFPRKSTSKKKKVDVVQEAPCLEPSAPKKPRTSSAKRTSRRTASSVNYVYPEIDPEWNPSGKRKRKRSSR